MLAAPAHRKLLVVDDEPLVRQTLDYCLRDDYEVTVVASGEEAIAASLREDYPVVILDLCMEGLSGIETLKRLKQIRESQSIIILTAYESTESAISALNLGAFNYLTKPFERVHLKEIISRGIEVHDQFSMRHEEMQRRLMSMHDSFFSLLCHEFNTPLNIILGFSELLLDNPKDVEQAAWIRDIRDAGTHLHDVLMEIVDYIGAAHMATAGYESRFTPGEILRPAAELFREKDICIEITPCDALARAMRGSANSLRLITRKLLRMASLQSRQIGVEVSIEDDEPAMLQLIVGHTGLRRGGLTAEEVEKLFEPYHPSLAGPDGYRTSLGLELATCRKIAEYARGSVDCRFNADGELDFVARLPVRLALEE